jgi:hypothetical protein
MSSASVLKFLPAFSAYNILHGLHRKHHSFVVVYRPLYSRLFHGHCLATGLHVTICN